MARKSIRWSRGGAQSVYRREFRAQLGRGSTARGRQASCAMVLLFLFFQRVVRGSTATHTRRCQARTDEKIPRAPCLAVSIWTAFTVSPLSFFSHYANSMRMRLSRLEPCVSFDSLFFPLLAGDEGAYAPAPLRVALAKIFFASCSQRRSRTHTPVCLFLFASPPPQMQKQRATACKTGGNVVPRPEHTRHRGGAECLTASHGPHALASCLNPFSWSIFFGKTNSPPLWFSLASLASGVHIDQRTRPRAAFLRRWGERIRQKREMRRHAPNGAAGGSIGRAFCPFTSSSPPPCRALSPSVPDRGLAR